MWCYQKPGFEALLLAELQRQQHGSQFCDTLLKTEGVSVPAHSCILSAISPHISSALSSMPPPPAGQSHLLEFRALGACTLLHMVRLLYCGEMAGEGEKEKQDAISAAAKLGIHGLVEVTKRDCKSRSEEAEGCHMEVGVQTELLVPEEDEGRRGRWRREERDGSTFLWKETLSDGRKDTWTQTEDVREKTCPPSHPAASFQTIDIAVLQSLGQADSHFVPPQIPYIPISLVYPSDENPTQQPLSALVDSIQESTTVVAPPHTFVPQTPLNFSSQATPCAADLQSWWAGPQGTAGDVAAAEEWEDQRVEQFEDNIPGYISYFLNPNKEGSGRGRARRRRGAGVGGTRRGGTGERRARRPRARTGGRGRGGYTQMVDVQEVGVSRLQKLFLQRCGVRMPRTGQGGGAVGRKLYLKTRELLKPANSCQRGRRRGKVWELQDGLPVGRPRRARAKAAPSVSFSSPHMSLYHAPTLSLQSSSSPGLLSPSASYVTPASSLLTPHAPPPPPDEEQPEHFDRLLEEVMMGLDILTNNNTGASHSQPSLPTSSSSCDFASCGNTLTQNKQQVSTTGLLETSAHFNRFTQVVAVARGGGSSSPANSEMPVLQQQAEGELNEMLSHFLQSFEQHVDSCTARQEAEMNPQSCTEASQPYTVLSNYSNTKTPITKTPHTPHLQITHTPHPARCSQRTEQQQSDEAETPPRRLLASARSAASPKHTEGSREKVTAPARKKKRINQYLFSLERKKVRKPVSAKTKLVPDRRDQQLQQMPVVKLERSGWLPANVTLQERSCLEVKKPAKTKSSSSSVTYPRDRAEPVSWSTKTYPIRSRFKEALIMDSVPFLEEPLQIKRPPSAGPRQRRPKKNGQLLNLSNEISSEPIQPVEPCGKDEQLERNPEKREEEFTVQPQEAVEAATRKGEKRGAESEQETGDEPTVLKRVCFEQMAQPTSETCVPSSQSADFVSKPATREITDVVFEETVSTAECLQREDGEEQTKRGELKLRETEESLMDEEMESNWEEMIDVDGESKDLETCQRRTAPTSTHFVEEKLSVSPASHSAKEVSLRLTGSCEEDQDEDIDVIGGSSPVPDPVFISWTESSDAEEEEGDKDIDVVGETDYASSAVVTTVR